MTDTQPLPTRTWPRRLWRFVRISLLIYLGVVLLFAVFENSLVYQPSQYPSGDWSLESGVEDAWFSPTDGTKLHGWLFEVENPRAVVLFSHGNGGSIAGRRGMFEMFREL